MLVTCSSAHGSNRDHIITVAEIETMRIPVYEIKDSQHWKQ